jgi:lipoprotein-anchoring transpeptidase ErfK/SrfK
MRRNRANQSLKAIATLLLLAMQAAAQGGNERAGHARRVLVSIPDRKLAVVEGDKMIRIFPVAVGARVSPSPAGEFQIVNRISNPTYYHPGVVIPAGASSPIGTRWIGMNKKGYGIHGTNEPRSIGKAASHGCIRLRNRDMEQLFAMLRVGDSVQIRALRDPETVALFGGASTQAVVATTQPLPAVRIGGGQ